MSCVGPQFHPKNFESSPCLGNPNYPPITQEGVEPLNPSEKHRGVRDLTFSSTWSSQVAGCLKVAQDAARKMAAWSTNTCKSMGLVSLGLSFLPSVQAETQSQENAQESFSWRAFALASLTTLAVGIAAGRYILRKPAVHAQKIGMVTPVIQGDAHIYMGGYDAKEHKGRLPDDASAGTHVSRLENPHKILVNLPQPPHYFTGRKEELEELHKQLQDKEKVALCGLGGIGKTALSLQYAEKYQSHYQCIHFIEGGDVSTGLLELADHLHIPDGKLQERLEWLQVRLKNLGDKYLLIFDGVDHPEAFGILEKYLPHQGACVLLTSRTPASARSINFEVLELHPLRVEEAVAFLTCATPNTDPHQAADLAKALGYLALGLDHAAAYMRERGLSFKEYIRQFEKFSLELFKDERLTLRPEETTILTTWEISLDAMEKVHHCPLAKEVLAFFSILGQAPIPLELTKYWFQQRFPSKSEIDLMDALRWLKVYSMIGSSTPDHYDVHVLVQKVRQDCLIPKEKERLLRTAVLILNSYNKVLKRNKVQAMAFWYIHASAVEQKVKTLSYADSRERKKVHPDKFVDYERVSLLREMSGWTRYIGHYEQSLQYSLEVLQVYGGCYEETALEFIGALNKVATALRTVGKYQQALKYHLNVLTVSQELYADDEATIANLQGAVGWDLKFLGEYEEALKYQEQSLQFWRKKGNLRKIAQTLNGIGATHRMRKKFQMALDCDKESLELRKQCLVHEDSLNMKEEVMRSSYSYGLDLEGLGKKQEALKCYIDACHISCEIYRQSNSSLISYFKSAFTLIKDLDSKDQYTALKTLLIKHFPSALSLVELA